MRTHRSATTFTRISVRLAFQLLSLLALAWTLHHIGTGITAEASVPSTEVEASDMEPSTDLSDSSTLLDVAGATDGRVCDRNPVQYLEIVEVVQPNGICWLAFCGKRLRGFQCALVPLEELSE